MVCLVWSASQTMLQVHLFASATVARTPSLSVVIPAFNERKRLPKPLAASLFYLRSQARDWEVIVVDDGSTDETAAALSSLREDEPHRLRVVRSPRNCGKGAALAAGACLAAGERILLMDADGSTPLTALQELEDVMDRVGCSIVVGARCASRPWYRELMGYTFRALASMAVSGVTDTQCGFKLLTRDAAALTLPHLHIERWAYDVEMLYVAQRLGLGVVSAQVPFEDVPGSKVTWWTPVEMLLDVIRVSTLYRLGVWELPQRGAQSNGKGSARPRRGTYTLLI